MPASRLPTRTLALLLALPGVAAAQDAAPDGATLPTIVISGGLTPVPADEYGRASTTLGGADLRRQGVATVADALTRVPGLAVSGTDLSNAVVRVRGHDGAQTLVLIDGVEQIADLGGTLIGGLDLSDVDRIEVLRGPQAASYGTGAAGGVVSIWTRRATTGLHYGATAEAGDATGVSADVAQRGARGGWRLSGAWRDDRGFDLSGGEGERDGLTRRGLSLSGDVAVTEDLTLGAALRGSREDYDFDSTNFAPTSAADYVIDDPFPHGRSTRVQGQLWAEWRQMDGRVSHRLSFDQARDRRSTAYSANFDPARVDTRRRALRYRLGFGLDGQPVESSAQVLSLMAERLTDDSPLDPRYHRATNSVALDYRGTLREGLTAQLAVRRDTNDSYADATSWNAALAWALPGTGVRLHASAGDGSRRPVFYELYGDGVYTLPNPGLRPERVRSVDAGVTLSFAGGAGEADVTVFAERFTDAIRYQSGPNYTGRYANVDGTSHRKGVEAALSWQVSDRVALRGQASLIDATNPEGERERRVPLRTLTLGGDWTSADGRLTLGADLRHVAGIRDTDLAQGKVVTLDPLTTLDVSARWALDERVALTARVENVADSRRNTVWGYAGRGRVVHVGLGARF